jgi:hypothetical protein
MDAMFFEHSCRDERQVVNGLAAGAMLRAPMDTKQIQVMAPEIYRRWWSDRSRGDERF